MMSRFAEWERKKIRSHNILRYKGSNADERVGIDDFGYDHRDAEAGRARDGMARIHGGRPRRAPAKHERMPTDRSDEQIVKASEPAAIQQFAADQSFRRRVGYRPGRRSRSARLRKWIRQFTIGKP